jgi:sugar lactone lactonase YvrE
MAFSLLGKDLFVGDESVIYKLASDGSRIIFANDLPRPAAMAFDISGNLFVAEIDSGGIDKFTPDGTKTTFASGFSIPFGLAFDTAGNLFVTDQSASTITKMTPMGQKSLFASGLGAPSGLAIDRFGNLFVCEVNDRAIDKFTPAGDRSTFLTDIDAPAGLVFDAAGNLFVSEFNNGIIEKVTPSGTRTTFATGLDVPFAIAFEPVSEKLRNLSTRGFVLTGDNVLIGGFIGGGSALVNNAVLVRAIGPSLAPFGVPDPLLDPTLEIHDATGAIIATNDDWEDTQSAQIEATGLAPGDPMEAAIYAALPAGSYTAIVRGVGDTTGNALIEVYSVR